MAELDEYWERLSLAPDDLEALEHVEVHLRGERQYDQLLQLYEDLSIKVDAAPAAEYMVRAAKLALESVHSAARAEEYLRSAIAADPDRLEARVELRHLLMSRGAVEDALLVYEAQLREQGQSRESSAGWVDIAGLALDRLKDLGRAFNALDSAEEADPENAEVFKLRARIHQERGQMRLVYQALVQELDIAEDTDDCLARFQVLLESMVRHPRLHPLVLEGAELLRAYRDDDPVALTCEHEVERFKKTWKQRVLDLDAEAMHVAITDEAKAAELWRMEAEIQLAYGEHQDSALVSLNKALGAAPGDEAGLALLRDVYEQSGRYGALVDELEKLAAGLGESSRSIELYMQAAALCKNELGNPAGSARMYRNVLAIETGHREASEALANYYLENDKPREAVRVLEQLAEHATSVGDQIDARLELAKLLEEQLDEPGEALLQFEKVIELNPHHGRAQATLEAAYRDNHDAEGLVRVLSVRANHGDWGAREAVHRELAELCAGPLNSPERAIDSLTSIYMHEPAAELREQIVMLARTEELLRSSVQRIEAALTGIANRGLRISELKALLPLYEEQLGEPGEALKIVQLCLELGEQDSGLCDAFERLLQAAAPVGDSAVAWFRDAADATSVSEAKGRARKLEALTLSGNDDDEAAAVVWHEVLRLLPHDETAFEELRDWYRRTESFSDLRDLLVAKRDGLEDDDPRAVEIGLELGSLYETAFDEPRRAAEAYIEVLQCVADDERATLGLERTLEQADDKSDIASVLRRVYQERESWRGVADMTEILLDMTEASAERLDALRDLSSLYECRLNQPDRALQWTLEALRESSGDSVLLEDTLRLAGATRIYRDTVDVLRKLRDASEGEARQQLSLAAAQIAMWAGDRDGAMADALGACGVVRELSSAAGEVLEELLVPGAGSDLLRERCGELIEPLSRDAQVAAWRVLAQRFEASWQDIQGAILAWTRLRDLGEQVQGANSELDRLYEASQDPRAWSEHLLGRVQQILPLEEHLELGRKLVDVLADELDEFERATEQGESLGELAPDRVWIWERLSRLYAEQADAAGLNATWERESPLLDDESERYDRTLDYAKLFADHTPASHQAVRFLEQATQSQPGESRAISMMQQLRDALDPDESLFHTLAGLELHGLESAERWEECCSRISGYLPNILEPTERAQLWARLASLQRERLDEQEAALDSFCQAFELDPAEHSIRANLEEQAGLVGDFERVVNLMGEVIESERGALVAGDLRRARAALYEDKLESPSQALAEWLMLSGGDIVAEPEFLKPMERLYRRLGDPEGLCRVLEVLPQTLDSLAIDAKLGCYYEAAEVAQAQLDDGIRALRALEAAAEVAPNPLRALNWQASILREGHDHRALLEVLEKLTRPGVENSERLEHLLEKAKIHHELAEYQKARELYAMILDERRDYMDARDGLEGLVDQGMEVEASAALLEPIYTVEKDYQKLVWILSKRLDKAEDPERCKMLMRRIGEHYETHLDRPQEAFEMARSILLEDPADIGVRVWFEQLAERLELDDDLATTYVELAKKCEAPQNLQYHRWAATILEQRLGDLERASEQYIAILALRDHDERALQGLEDIYRKLGRHAELVGVMRKRMAGDVAHAERADYLRQIARIELEDLGRPLDAANTLLELYGLDPERLGVFDSLESLYEDHQRWTELADLYGRERERLGTRDESDSWDLYRDLSFRQGVLLFDELDDTFGAAAIFEDLLDDETPHENTLAFLEERAGAGEPDCIRLLLEHYGRAHRWEELLRVLRVKLNFSEGPEAKRDILLEIAKLEEVKMEHAEPALAALAEAFEALPAETDLLRTMYQLAERTGAYSAWLQGMQQVLPLVEPPVERRGFLHAMGGVARDSLGDSERAIEVYAQLIDEHPGDDSALAALDVLYRDSEQWTPRADILERRLELSDDVLTRRDLGEALADLYRVRLEDVPATAKVYERLSEDDPAWLAAYHALESLYRELERWQDLEQCLLTQLKLCDDDPERLRLEETLASLYQDTMASPPQAIERWHRVLSLEPTHAPAIGALDELLSAADDSEGLVELLGHVITHIPSELGHILTHRRRARLLRDELERPADAADDWRALLKHQPDDLESLQALSDIYEGLEDWSPWTEVVARRLDLNEATDHPLRLRFADVLGTHLDQHERAGEQLSQVLGQDDVSAVLLERLAEIALSLGLSDTAAMALERAAASESDESLRLYRRVVEVYRDIIGSPDEARTAWEAIAELTGGDSDSYEALGDIYRRSKLFSELVELHEKMLPSLDEERRGGALREIVDAQRGPLENPEMAFVTACRLYREQPDDVEVSDILETLATDLGCLDEVVALIEDQVDGITDSRVRLELFMKLGRLHDTALSEPDEAEASYERALEIEPFHPGALEGLMKLAIADERFDKQLNVLERKIRGAQSIDEKREQLLRVAKIWEEEIGDESRAIATLERVRNLLPDDREAIDWLCRLHRGLSQFEPLVKLLKHLTGMVEEPSELVEIYRELGTVSETSLDAVDDAVEWFQKQLALAPGDRRAWSDLSRLYERAGRHEDLLQLLGHELEHVQESDGRVAIYRRRAEILEVELGDLAGAANDLRAWLDIAPNDVDCIQALCRVLRELGEWNELIERMRHLADVVAADPDARARVFLELGEVYHNQLARVDLAEQSYNEARQLIPDSSEALHALGQLYERSGNWFQALEMLEHEAELVSEPHESAQLFERIGRINEEMLLNRNGAVDAYQRAIAKYPSSLVALEALKTMAREDEDWGGYARYLELILDAVSEPDDRFDLLVEMAEHKEAIEHDDLKAIDLLEEAAEIDASDLECLLQLAELHFRCEQWVDAGKWYRHCIELMGANADGKLVCQAHYRLGYTCEKLEQFEQALSCYQQAVHADPTSLAALEALAQMLLGLERFEEAKEAFEKIISHHRAELTESEIVDIHWQLGELAKELGDAAVARQSYEHAIAMDPNHAHSLRALGELEAAAERWEPAYKLLDRYSRLIVEQEREPVLMQLADIAMDHLGDGRGAIEILVRGVKSGGPELLERLGRMFLASGDKQKAAHCFSRAVDSATDVSTISRLAYELGQLYDQHLGNEVLAMDAYNKALDAQPTNMRAFEDIEALLVKRQEWRLLEQNYRAMLTRSRELSPRFRLVLWRHLASLYAKVFDDVDNAIMAYEVVVKMAPDSLEDRQALASLYGRRDDLRERAIELEHGFLGSAPELAEGVRRLKVLYHREADFDAVYQCCSVLHALDSADEDEFETFRHLGRGLKGWPDGGLTDDSWAKLFPDSIHGPVGELAAELYRHAPDAFIEDDRRAGIKRREIVSLDSDLFVAGVVRGVLRALGLPPLRLVLRRKSMEPIKLAHVRPLALMIGENNDLVQSTDQRMARFLVGQNVAYSRPELFLIRKYPAEQLRELLLGFCTVYNRNLEVASHSGITNWADRFERLPGEVLRLLQESARRAYPELLTGQSTQALSLAAEQTSARAGLLACGDISAGLRGLAQSPTLVAGLGQAERARRLLNFASSKEYLRICKAMGQTLTMASGSVARPN